MKVQLKPWMVAVVAPVVMYLGLDAAARVALWREGWFDTWQYTTRADRELGYRLRPRVSNQFDRSSVRINDDGFRSATSGGHIAAKASGELLVATFGDSNTFGSAQAYEDTYSIRLERTLKARLNRAVRVVNFGVPGYSLAQTLITLKHWLHLKPDVVVVTVNSFNDRVFLGRPDSPFAFEADARARPYEFGEAISYPMLYWYRKQIFPRLQSTRPPDLAGPLPVPRVPRAAYPRLLQDLVDSTSARGIRLVWLVTSESGDSPAVDAGLRALAEHRLEDALGAFRTIQSAAFLPAYHAYQLASALGRTEEARSIRARYEAEYGTVADHYPLNSTHFSSEYLAMVREVSDRAKVPLVDLRERFREAGVSFRNGHFDGKGHALVAERLADAVEDAARSSVRIGSIR